MEENKNVGTQEQAEVKTEEKKTETVEPKTETKTEVKAEPKKENWFKRHWKGLAAGVAGTGAAAASVIVAWKKGKQAGINSAVEYYNPPHETSPLDPNV